MIELDGDEIRISSRGRYAERDIVQVKAHVLFSKLFSNLKAIFEQIFFFKLTKAKIPDSEGSFRRINLERQGSVCVQAFYIFFFFYGKQPKQHLSHIGGCSELSPGHLNPWMFWTTDGMLHTHRANGTAPSICEESAKSESFSLKSEFM